MAKTKWWVVYDFKNDGAGYNGIAAKTKFKKGETLGTEELITGTGQAAVVWDAKVVQVEAEGAEEACIIAGEAYGNRNGLAATPHAEKELEFFHV